MVGTTVKKVGQYNNLMIQPTSSSEKFKGRFIYYYYYYYGKEILALRENKPILKSSPISTLNPFIGSDDILRVGGRLKNASVLISREKASCNYPWQTSHSHAHCHSISCRSATSRAALYRGSHQSRWFLDHGRKTPCVIYYFQVC